MNLHPSQSPTTVVHDGMAGEATGSLLVIPAAAAAHVGLSTDPGGCVRPYPRLSDCTIMEDENVPQWCVGLASIQYSDERQQAPIACDMHSGSPRLSLDSYTAGPRRG